ncbi:MAG: hypothetical protein KZQ95_22010 [Candidatus Thiodiazotropha sp. (ex Epidulcina cf. delphinae)]|nr:hypothetical protein [Candidatus Thiodiazotropha sp. (ex Epidulcina cf. delphinae)]
MKRQTILTMLAGSFLIVACVKKEDVVKTAQEKELVVSGQTLIFGGAYNVTRNNLEVTVNGDPVMKGVFRNFNPTQNLNADYKGLQISSRCYFGSVLGNKGGIFGAVARGIQSAKSRTGDECEILVDGRSVEKLYF